MEKEGRITTSLCSKFLEVSNNTALRELTRLFKSKIIIKKGNGKSLYYTLR